MPRPADGVARKLGVWAFTTILSVVQQGLVHSMCDIAHKQRHMQPRICWKFLLGRKHRGWNSFQQKKPICLTKR